jgi:hypothetical protein
MSLFCNGIHPEERRLMALGFAVECTSDKQDHKLTREAAQNFDAFLAGRGTEAQAEPVNTVVRLKLPGG